MSDHADIVRMARASMDDPRADPLFFAASVWNKVAVALVAERDAADRERDRQYTLTNQWFARAKESERRADWLYQDADAKASKISELVRTARSEQVRADAAEARVKELEAVVERRNSEVGTWMNEYREQEARTVAAEAERDEARRSEERAWEKAFSDTLAHSGRVTDLVEILTARECELSDARAEVARLKKALVLLFVDADHDHQRRHMLISLGADIYDSEMADGWWREPLDSILSGGSE